MTCAEKSMNYFEPEPQDEDWPEEDWEDDEWVDDDW
jgi:hypothetical protein